MLKHGAHDTGTNKKASVSYDSASYRASIPGGGGVGRAISHIFKSGGVEGLVISTNMWRLDRQTNTQKAAISDISESTYAKVTYLCPAP